MIRRQRYHHNDRFTDSRYNFRQFRVYFVGMMLLISLSSTIVKATKWSIASKHNGLSRRRYNNIPCCSFNIVSTKMMRGIPRTAFIHTTSKIHHQAYHCIRFERQRSPLQRSGRRGFPVHASFTTIKNNGSIPLKMMNGQLTSLYVSQYDDETSIVDEELDTIYALATGSGSTIQRAATAIAIIRMTGPQSVPIVQQLCQQDPTGSSDVNTNVKGDKNTLTTIQPRKVYLRKLYHPVTKEILDEAIIIYYQKPYSYTGEDCIEIQCHGSRAVIQDIFHTLQHPYFSTYNVRMAEPGEFTQRAYSSGKMDLLQIEALSDLIVSETSEQRKQALIQYDGAISDIYNDWRQQLIKALAHAEAIIDFGDDEVLEEQNDDDNDDIANQRQLQQVNIWGRVTKQIQDLIQQMEYQIYNERRGELVRDGVKIAIVGPPNVGKSSLLNILSYRDAAIVSNIAGTTRDIVEVPMNLNGIKCILQDTAGVRTTPTTMLNDNDYIEQIGIDRAIQAAQKADIILAVIDSSDISTGRSILSKLLDSPNTLMKDSGDKNTNSNNASTTINPNHVLVVYNKADLQTTDDSSINLNDDNIQNNHDICQSILNDSSRCVRISCTTSSGIDVLLDTLTRQVTDRVHGGCNSNDSALDDNVDTPTRRYIEQSPPMITRTRHRQHIMASIVALQRFVVLSQQGSMMIDMAAEELRLATSELGRITGAVDVEDVLDKLFADFCIGK